MLFIFIKGKFKNNYFPYFRAVSRHELFPIRAPLVALEHCIAPFLDGCDSNNDHEITLNEWVKCMEIEEVIIILHFLFLYFYFLFC